MNVDKDDVIRNIHKLPSELIDFILSCLPACALDIFLSYPPLVHHVATFIVKNAEVVQPSIKPHKQTESISVCRHEEHAVPSFAYLADHIEFCMEYDVWPNVVSMHFEVFQRNDVQLFEVFKSIRLWDRIDADSGYDKIRDKLSQVNIHELQVNFSSWYSNTEIISTFPKNLRYLEIENEKTFGDMPVFKQFQFLESLYLRTVNMDFLRCIPPSLSKLEIEEFEVHRNPEPTDPVLPNLKTFIVFDIDKTPRYTIEPVFRQMPNLQEFSNPNATAMFSHDFQLPASLKSLTLSGLAALTHLTQYQNLRELVLDICVFPVEEFQNTDNFPHLRSFKFNNDKYYKTTIDHLQFPGNLQILELNGYITIKKWTLPKSLRRLELRGIDVGDDFEFDFPSSVYHLAIKDTQLQSLDGVMFPTELTYLEIIRNQHLISMDGTNLLKLERLVQVKAYWNTKFQCNDLVEFGHRDSIIYQNRYFWPFIESSDESGSSDDSGDSDDMSNMEESDDSDDSDDMDDSDDSDEMDDSDDSDEPSSSP
ncbi:hypothetical protein G210_5616 [Candida maltosa Xu316]|uniref:F-box domain-containing protein n=1 Tax=Candida maltosa (strain Xu316) TaxID=1245528 RepID=M3JBU8_CANMX|nr:hypothetical protein G210_5616 [Candida maltosa Xu316]